MVTVQISILHKVNTCSLVHETKSRDQAGRSRFQEGLKIIKVALSAALKPTVVRDLEPRSKPCLRTPFPKVNRLFYAQRKRLRSKTCYGESGQTLLRYFSYDIQVI